MSRNRRNWKRTNFPEREEVLDKEFHCKYYCIERISLLNSTVFVSSVRDYITIKHVLLLTILPVYSVPLTEQKYSWPLVCRPLQTKL